MAVDDTKHGWYLHVLSLVQYRAETYDEALRANARARESDWEGGLAQIDLVAAMVHQASGNNVLGRQHLATALELIKQIEQDSGDAVTAVGVPDWLEINILRREANDLLGSLDVQH